VPYTGASRPAAWTPARTTPKKSAPRPLDSAWARTCSTTSSAKAIKALEGEGADARANIDFKRHGAKWLALSVAKLDPID
jgi:DNA helicase-2/ATP-dependent DNA helicase PcrA